LKRNAPSKGYFILIRKRASFPRRKRAVYYNCNIDFSKAYKNGAINGGKKQVLKGCTEVPWNGDIVFDNVIIAGKKLTNLDDFETNEFVYEISFK